MPPNMNTARQPKCGISEAATKPPAPEPKLKPVNMIVSSNDRLRDEYVFGEQRRRVGHCGAEPSAPVRKRSIMSCVEDSANAHIIRLNRPKQNTEPIGTLFLKSDPV